MGQGIVGMLILSLVIVSASPVSAAHNLFNPHISRDAITVYDRYLYRDILGILPCIDVNEFYAYADSNPFDGLSRGDATDYLDRMSISDFNGIASQNPYDGIDGNLFNPRTDFRCSTREEFWTIARQNPFDALDDEDYYRLYGYQGGSDFSNRMRHGVYEGPYFFNPPHFSPYQYSPSYNHPSGVF